MRPATSARDDESDEHLDDPEHRGRDYDEQEGEQNRFVHGGAAAQEEVGVLLEDVEGRLSDRDAAERKELQERTRLAPPRTESAGPDRTARRRRPDSIPLRPSPRVHPPSGRESVPAGSGHLSAATTVTRGPGAPVRTPDGRGRTRAVGAVPASGAGASSSAPRSSSCSPRCSCPGSSACWCASGPAGGSSSPRSRVQVGLTVLAARRLTGARAGWLVVTTLGICWLLILLHRRGHPAHHRHLRRRSPLPERDHPRGRRGLEPRARRAALPHRRAVSTRRRAEGERDRRRDHPQRHHGASTRRGLRPMSSPRPHSSRSRASREPAPARWLAARRRDRARRQPRRARADRHRDG